MDKWTNERMWRMWKCGNMQIGEWKNGLMGKWIDIRLKQNIKNPIDE